MRTSIISPGPDPKQASPTQMKSAETASMSDEKRPVPKPSGGAAFKNFPLKPQPVAPTESHQTKGSQSLPSREPSRFRSSAARRRAALAPTKTKEVTNSRRGGPRRSGTRPRRRSWRQSWPRRAK